MDRRPRKIQRESEAEQVFEQKFKEYEEWRATQTDEVEETKDERRTEKQKRFKLGKIDLILIVVGLVAGMVFRACQSARGE